METTKICPAVWLSGFFALGALAHLLRTIFRFSLVVGGFEVPLGMSLVITMVLGALSIGLLYVGGSKPCCKK
jgi:hypothetical protein